ncbi:hypothetical protein DQ04_12831020 [Trypanosoma grayi]|uniref:hypothetical protein n=1 Tax=Trypanosoma grayi TaxID=71804 RepID=UPI0004F49FB8|nr:hypothetical protein DQ04_12831020 [Trypanosoma grayi]KEG06667.1 hypothetical protein DQ04_12831020 [Trypanosoma grayi]
MRKAQACAPRCCIQRSCSPLVHSAPVCERLSSPLLAAYTRRAGSPEEVCKGTVVAAQLSVRAAASNSHNSTGMSQPPQLCRCSGAGTAVTARLYTGAASAALC